jgi:hypothetical protein
MVRSLSAAVAMVMLPSLLLIAAAHTGLFASGSSPLTYAIFFLAWIIGMAAILSAGWPRRITVGLMVIYTIIGIPALPFAALLAVCSTGDCI